LFVNKGGRRFAAAFLRAVCKVNVRDSGASGRVPRKALFRKMLWLTSLLTPCHPNVNFNAGCLFLRTLLIGGLLVIALSGCARRPVSANWRFVIKDSVDFLLPPGPANPALATKLAPVSFLIPTDLVPPVRIQVVSPIVRDPAAPIIEETTAAETSTGLALSLRTTDNFIGYETALYAVQPKAKGSGYSIAALSAERHFGREIEHSAQPATNYFDFPPDSAFFRLFVKSGQTDFTALVIAAPTKADLESTSALLDSGAETCDRLPAAHCIAIPRRVAINAVMAVTMNGTESFIRWGATLAEALRGAAVRQPENTLPTLSISRTFRNQLAPIDFDRTDPAILRLPLNGGEVISWSAK
jgi:hypothetical protein